MRNKAAYEACINREFLEYYVRVKRAFIERKLLNFLKYQAFSKSVKFPCRKNINDFNSTILMEKKEKKLFPVLKKIYILYVHFLLYIFKI